MNGVGDTVGELPIIGFHLNSAPPLTFTVFNRHAYLKQFILTLVQIGYGKKNHNNNNCWYLVHKVFILV